VRKSRTRDRFGLPQRRDEDRRGYCEQVRIERGIAGNPRRRRFEGEVAMRTSVSGVATGLAWTPVGGDILFIEASASPAEGGLILTGQLGEVMREKRPGGAVAGKSRAVSLG